MPRPITSCNANQTLQGKHGNPILGLGFIISLVSLPRMANSADAMRRWLGAFCLAMAFGMLVWGETVLKPFLKGILFLIFWLTCFLFTCSAIVFALLDVRAVRRRIEAEQRELIERTIQQIENDRTDAD